MKKTFLLESILTALIVLIIWLLKTGTAAPQISITLSSLDFGTAVIGTSTTANMIIQNSGAGGLIAHAISLCPGNGTDSTMVGQLP